MPRAATMPPKLNDMSRRHDLLIDLLNMSRAQRRARGVRATNAQLQHELGAVRYMIERMEDTAFSSNIGPASTETLDGN